MKCFFKVMGSFIFTPLLICYIMSLIPVLLVGMVLETSGCFKEDFMRPVLDSPDKFYDWYKAL